MTLEIDIPELVSAQTTQSEYPKEKIQLFLGCELAEKSLTVLNRNQIIKPEEIRKVSPDSKNGFSNKNNTKKEQPNPLK